jgi:cytoskeletal protein RodZ
MNKINLCKLRTIVLGSLFLFFGFIILYSFFKTSYLEGNTNMNTAFNNAASGSNQNQALSAAGDVSRSISIGDYNNGPPAVSQGPITRSPAITTPQVTVPTTPQVTVPTTPQVTVPTTTTTTTSSSSSSSNSSVISISATNPPTCNC